MSKLLEEISQISIYLKQRETQEERVNEIALFAPFTGRQAPTQGDKILHQRQWFSSKDLKAPHRLFLNIQTFFFKKMRPLLSPERKTPEAKFKTVLAILLAQEEVRSCFFKQQATFLKAIKESASLCGYKDFVLPAIDAKHTPLKIAKKLTRIKGKRRSLIDDPAELQRQMASLKESERDEILFALLSRIQRPPVSSVIEVVSQNDQKEPKNIEIETQFGKVEVEHIDKKSGRVAFIFAPDKATSSVHTTQGPPTHVMNQRIAVSIAEQKPLGGYCGALLTKEHVCEQLIFLLGFHSDLYLLPSREKGKKTHQITLLFTSLFSWMEAGKMTKQYQAISELNGKVLSGKDKEGNPLSYQLHLLYHNIPFSAATKYPAPKETVAHLEDINEECYLALTFEVLQKIQREGATLSSQLQPFLPKLLSLYERLQGMQEVLFYEKSLTNNDAFLKREKERLDLIDQWKNHKKELIETIDYVQNTHPLLPSLFALLKKEDAQSKPLDYIDQYIYAAKLATDLSYLHNTNCFHSTDRSAGAIAASKAQYVYTKLSQRSYTPHSATANEEQLFKVLYSLYLVFEEPEITTALSTGFLGEKFHNNLLLKNPETTKYLIRWIKDHPKIYLGLSQFRS